MKRISNASSAITDSPDDKKQCIIIKKIKLNIVNVL